MSIQTPEKWTALPAATVPLSGTEIIALVQSGVSKQAPVSAIGSADASFITATSMGLLPQSRVLTAGTNITITDNPGAKTITISSSGGGGSPGGSDGQIQINIAGSFGATANLTWDSVNDALTLTGPSNFGSLQGVSGGVTNIFGGASTDANAPIITLLNNAGAAGGLISISGGFATSGNGGDISITAGDGAIGTFNGGAVSISGGLGSSAALAGLITLSTNGSVRVQINGLGVTDVTGTLNVNGNQVIDSGTASQTIFFDVDSSGQGLAIVNASTGTAATVEVGVANASHSLRLDLTGTAYAGASLLTGGPAGEAGYLIQTGNVPISVGTNGVELMRLSGAGAITLTSGVTPSGASSNIRLATASATGGGPANSGQILLQTGDPIGGGSQGLISITSGSGVTASQIVLDETGVQLINGGSQDMVLSLSGSVKFENTTTGASTGTFTTSNKPGSNSGIIAWIPVKTAGGTQGYLAVVG